MPNSTDNNNSNQSNKLNETNENSSVIGAIPTIKAAKTNRYTRSRARRFTLQAMYQWQLTGANLIEIEAQFLADNDANTFDVAYFVEMLHQIPKKLDTIDEAMTPFLDRKIDELDPIEKMILRIGIYELAYRPDVPYRVAINEALELAKLFGADESFKYVNGILDRVAKVLRAVEIKG